MMKVILSLLLCLVATVASAQTATEPFGIYVNALPAASSPGSADQFYLRQGGTSKQLPFSSFVVPNSNLANMTGPALKGITGAGPSSPADLTGLQAEGVLQFLQSGTSAVTRALDAKLKTDGSVSISLQDFGAVGNGSTDDAAAFNAAVAALPASGGRIVLQAGLNYCIKSPITVGNGTTSGASTTSGIYFEVVGGGTQGQSTIVWCGSSSSSAMFVVQGPMNGWGFKNILFNCASLVQNGVKLVAASHGEMNHIQFDNCTSSSLLAASLTTPNFANTQFNTFNDIDINVPNSANAQAITLTGDGSDNNTNTSLNTFNNIQIVFPSASTAMIGVNLIDEDSNAFTNLSMIGGGTGTQGILFNYSGSHNSGVWPESNTFVQLDTGLISVSSGTQIANNGSPNASAHPNEIFGMVEGNGATCPSVANLTCYGGNTIVLTNGGTATPTTFDGAAWTTYSITPTCGTGTVTTNSSKFKKLGKTVAVEADVSITVITGCTNSLSFALPTTANSGGALAGFQVSNGNAVTCRVQSGGSTASCTPAGPTNFGATTEVSISGVYESQ